MDHAEARANARTCHCPDLARAVGLQTPKRTYTTTRPRLRVRVTACWLTPRRLKPKSEWPPEVLLAGPNNTSNPAWPLTSLYCQDPERNRIKKRRQACRLGAP